MTDAEVRILETDESLTGLGPESFHFGAAPASLALAFVSPHGDFAAITRNLMRIAGATPVLALSTCGHLCSWEEGTQLYRPTATSSTSLVVQIFSPALIAAVSIHPVPLPNEGILLDASPLSWDERVQRISASLAEIRPAFPLGAETTFALTLIDGACACEGEFVEALYAHGRFPVLYAGGLASGELGCRHTFLFDGTRVMEDHAILAFVKIAEGRHYGVLTTHNFVPTDKSLLVIDANPNRRTVSLVEENEAGEIMPLPRALCRLLDVPPEGLLESLQSHALGVEIGGEIYLRSILDIDPVTDTVSFFSGITPGDRLVLLRAEDYLVKTSTDIHTFLQYKPRAITAILCDCIKRRHGDALDQTLFSSPWPMPVAGFSTFGEIMGVKLNETLVAIVFFEGESDRAQDEFLENFPLIYAGFAQTRLRHLQVLSQLLIHAAGEIDKLVDSGTASRLPIHDYYGDVGRLHASFRRLTKKLAAAKDAMEHLASHDALTGLPNRREMLNRLRRLHARAHRHGGTYALLFIDLDKFKPVNDELGHEAGDQALIEVARRLSSVTRASDTVARLGGDEFVIVAADTGPGPAEAEEAARRIARACLQEMNRPFLLAGQERHLGLSIGISIGDRNSAADILLASADRAMYVAKHASGDRFVCADELDGTVPPSVEKPGTAPPASKSASTSFS